MTKQTDGRCESKHSGALVPFKAFCLTHCWRDRTYKVPSPIEQGDKTRNPSNQSVNGRHRKLRTKFCRADLRSFSGPPDSASPTTDSLTHRRRLVFALYCPLSRDHRFEGYLAAFLQGSDPRQRTEALTTSIPGEQTALVYHLTVQSLGGNDGI